MVIVSEGLVLEFTCIERDKAPKGKAGPEGKRNFPPGLFSFNIVSPTHALLPPLSVILYNTTLNKLLLISRVLIESGQDKRRGTRSNNTKSVIAEVVIWE